MQYSTLIAQIEADIYSNGAELITGDILQTVLKRMVSAWASAGAAYGGTISPDTVVPLNLDQATVYLALTAGTYEHFLDGEGDPIETTGPALVIYDGGPALIFSKTDLPVIPSGGTTGQVLAKASGTDYDVEWTNGGGEEIDTVAVSVDNNTGTPSATGSVSGSTLSLSFHNLKGATGATGPQGPQGQQGNTGSSVNYPYELVNNLTTDDATKGLSAAQGVVLEGKISQLGQEVDELTDGVDLVVNTPKIINLSGGVGTIAPASSNLAGWGYYDAECVEGAKITVSGSGGNYGLWGFVDANGIILSWSGTQVSGNNKEIIAPANTARVIINTYTPGSYPAPKMILPTSIIGKIDALVAKTDKTNYNVSKLLTEKEVSPVFETGYITSTGNIASNSNYKYGIFDAKAGDIIIVNFNYSSGAISVISVQHPELSVFDPKVLASSGQTEYQYLCTEDCKIVISGLSASLTYKVIHSRIDEQIQASGLPTAIQRVFPDFTINNGSYWNKSGTISSLGGWIRSSGAFLKKGTAISLYWGGQNNPYISIITEVDEQGGFLRACLLTPNPNVAGNLKFVVDKDGYYAISNTKSNFYWYQIIYFVNGDLFFNPPLDHLFLPTQDGLPREILRSPSFVGIVHKWGFIGDSLSSGEQAVKKDGTSTLERFDLYDYSWGQRLCKLNSVEGFNFSVGGQTTKGWCSGIDERTWAGAQLQENWKEAYCIALGVNDRSALSPGDADTDINLSDYTQNADTFAGWYAGIIQRLRSVNPKCRIFCITIPYNQQVYLENNEVIRAIVPKFNRCYLVDLANYHWTPSGLGLNDHLSPAGYQWAAFEINTYIDWIIRNNMDDFKDIAWVGTEYSA